MSRTSTPQIGDLIHGRYEILSIIGEGGFGVVYRARQRPTGQLVAIKLLLPEKLMVASNRQLEQARFSREMTLISRLKHPNIVRLIDSGELAGGQLFMVLEHVEGESLSERIARDGALQIKETRRLMMQVLEALHYAHSQGVVHRDLKPGNIMVTSAGGRVNAMVLDFGIANLTEDAREGDYHKLTATGQVHGTPGYMAPEQLEGELTPQSDLYAWGLVFIECLTGKPAVNETSVAKIIFAQLSPDPIPLPALVEGTVLGDLLGRAVAKPRGERYANASEALADLEGQSSHSLALRSVGTLGAPSDDDGPTRPGTIWAMASVGVVMLGALVWGVWPAAEHDPSTDLAGSARQDCPIGQAVGAATQGQCCWPGQVWGRERCVGIPERCPAGHQIDAEAQTCVPQTCYGGRERTVLDLKCCWPGQGWDPEGARCKGVPQCNEPYLRDGERCVRLGSEAWAAHLQCDAGEAASCLQTGLSVLGQPHERTPSMSELSDALAHDFLERACTTDAASGGCAWLGLLVGPLTREVESHEPAFALFQRACEAGDALGCFNEGWYHIRGFGTPVDYNEGQRALVRACEGGHSLSCTQLGQFLADGWPLGVARPEEAVPRFRAGCTSGDPFGCLHMGLAVLNGVGVEANPGEASGWLRRACKHGVRAACAMLESPKGP